MAPINHPPAPGHRQPHPFPSEPGPPGHTGLYWDILGWAWLEPPSISWEGSATPTARHLLATPPPTGYWSLCFS